MHGLIWRCSSSTSQGAALALPRRLVGRRSSYVARQPSSYVSSGNAMPSCRIPSSFVATTCRRKSTKATAIKTKRLRVPPQSSRRLESTTTTTTTAEAGAPSLSSATATTTTRRRLFPAFVATLRQARRTQRQYVEWLEQVLRQPRTVPIPRWITPRHHTITLSEVCGHSSFLLVGLSYAVDDFYWLRVIAVAGSTSMLFFTYFHPYGRILWLPFKWNVLFIGINLYRIGKIHFDHYLANKLPMEWIQFRNRNFYLMDPSDFAALVQAGTVHEYEPGDWIIEQGQGNSHVGLVLDGSAKVFVDGQVTYLLEEANFVHECGLHAGLLLPGKIEGCCSVVAETPTKILTWDRTDLVQLMHRNGGVRRSLKAILSWDIVRKLKQQRVLLSSHQIDDPEEWTDRRNRQTHYRYRAILRNMCEHPHYLNERRKQLAKYRMIHNIDDQTHLEALREIGWTVEEFEAGHKEGAAVNDEEETFWMRLYSRLFQSNKDFE